MRWVIRSRVKGRKHWQIFCQAGVAKPSLPGDMSAAIVRDFLIEEGRAALLLKDPAEEAGALELRGQQSGGIRAVSVAGKAVVEKDGQISQKTLGRTTSGRDHRKKPRTSGRAVLHGDRQRVVAVDPRLLHLKRKIPG